MRQIVLIAHNLRSTHNVGSLLRTADGLGVTTVYFTGYTPYPLAAGDDRLPYIAQKLHKQIAKTALGAENSVAWRHESDIFTIMENLKREGFTIAALEQTPHAVPLTEFKPPDKLAMIVGREVEGIEPEILQAAGLAVVIPMSGKKESYNVAIAAAIALYHCVYSR
jgi:23S rRNA (guanosine2251-2'-O)-methyltransferase